MSRAAVTLESGDAPSALAQIEALAADRVATYQAYFVVKAKVMRALGRREEAWIAHDQALALTEDPAIRAFLEREAGPRQDGAPA